MQLQTSSIDVAQGRTGAKYIRHMVTAYVQLNQSATIVTPLPFLCRRCCEHLLCGGILRTISIVAIALADRAGLLEAGGARPSFTIDMSRCDERRACRARAVSPVARLKLDGLLLEAPNQVGTQIESSRCQGNRLTAAAWWEQRFVRDGEVEKFR